MQPMLHMETHSGTPVQAGGYTITPFARSVRLQVKGFPGGAVWNRPVSVHVQTPAGQEYTLPVHDVTRQVQLTLLGTSLGMVIVFWLISRLLHR